MCVKAYKKSLDDEIDLELGAIVDVIQKGSDGWWEVRYVSICQSRSCASVSIDATRILPRLELYIVLVTSQKF